MYNVKECIIIHSFHVSIGIKRTSGNMHMIQKTFFCLVCFVGFSLLLDVFLTSTYNRHSEINNSKFNSFSFLLSNEITCVNNGKEELSQTLTNKEKKMTLCGKKTDERGRAPRLKLARTLSVTNGKVELLKRKKRYDIPWSGQKINKRSGARHVKVMPLPTHGKMGVSPDSPSILQSVKGQLLPKNVSNVNILLWNSFHGSRRWWHTVDDRIYRQCGMCSCLFVYDKKATLYVDAVMFEYNTDLVRYKQHRKILNVPTGRKSDQYWILYNHEPHQRNQDLKSNFLFDNLHRAGFNLSANYRNEADIILKYGECFPRPIQNYSTNAVNFVANKTGLIVWIVSNCEATSRRNAYVNELNTHIIVDIVGDCGDSNTSKNFGIADFISPVAEINKYKFYLAFENTFCDQYISEKVFKILHDEIRVVPIVRGAGPYHKYLPRGSYIDVADFSTPKYLADYLYKLDKNDTLYNAYFKPREHYLCQNYFASFYTWPCKVCNSVCQLKKNNTREVLLQDEINQLFSPLYTCHYP